ncbi:2143_t:CDS:2 [Acaulospora colombiana]|uniref:2143_t:CDS:1 n=1 Tax=Acaulospora colombiana TaxID=27376 RepID=A0ACA9LNC2_9GLOM|nr:2143_t:CDS:2 [Acaulospora colombiana]
MDHSGQSPEIRGRPDESPEEALMASFRVAAESVAQLFKTSLNQKKRYDNGYEQCLRDLMEFVASHPNVQQRRQQTGGDGRDAFISVEDLCNFAQSKTEHLKSISRRNREDVINVPDNQIYSYSGIPPVSENIFGTNNDQFEFSLQPNSMHHPIQHEIDSIDTGQEGGIGILTGNDSLKRRFGGSTDLNFLGRPTFLEHSFLEPPAKKGRLRKDE